MKQIYPAVILINGEKKTNPFIHTFMTYNCNFTDTSIDIQSNNPTKAFTLTIAYQEIAKIELSLCSRISSSGGIGRTMTPSLTYNIDIIIEMRNQTYYYFEIQPTATVSDIIKFIKNMDITLVDKFNIQKLVSNPNFYEVFNSYMSAHFAEFATTYNLDNPRKKY